MKKYELTDETIDHNGTTLYRIRALRDFGNVKAGDLGGYIESENNLDHRGDCWVFDNAHVFGNARVCDTAHVFASARVFGNARVFDNAIVFGNARVFGSARVFDTALVSGNFTLNNSSMAYGDVKLR
jgi:predicted acyltransferase (DUF342 family)